MTRSIKFFRRVTFALWPVLLMPGLVRAQEQKELPERSTLAPEHTWNLSGMFSSRGTWESELKAVERAIMEVERLKEVAGVSASALEETLGLYERAAARVDRVMLYASLRHDLDTRDDAARADENRAQLLGTRFAEATSWMEPAILAIPPETLNAWTKDFGSLKKFGHFIDDIVRKRAHVLDKEGEALLASVRELARAPETIYSTLTNAELSFPTIRDEHGDEVTLSAGRYSKFMRSADRRVRRDAFKGTLQAYLRYKNTCAAALSAQVQRDIFLAKARKYKTSLEASLAVDNIPPAVYHNLVKTINANLHHMHRYARLRKRVLKLDELHVYDLFCPLTPEVEVKIPYDKAVDTMLTGLAPLGDDYVQHARMGLSNRWVDVWETRGKRTGAYCASTFLSHPFLLLNYNETYSGMSTLAHEMGHAMHSFYTNRHQRGIYSEYPTFTAEVASTVNEILLQNHLLETTEDPKIKLFYVNEFLESIRGTVFTQVMFAEFEQLIHETAERGDPLTADSMAAMYRTLVTKYYGPTLVLDEEVDGYWIRIPHFYYNFYVYQYATSYSAGTNIARRILRGEPGAREAYRALLRAGNSDYAVKLLKKAGVDMTTPGAIEETMALFGEFLDQLEMLLGEQ